MANNVGNFWAGHDKDPDIGYSTAVAITPADADFANGFIPRALYVAGAGTLVVRTKDDPATAVTITATAGLLLPLRVVRVAAASTATGIIALS